MADRYDEPTIVTLYWGRLDVADAEVEALARSLSDDERQRADRFRFDRDRRRFLVRRGRLRQLLGESCGCDPAHVDFEIGPYGKPQLTAGRHFSASNSGDHWAVALADCDLGLDIERIDPTIDYLGVASQLFAPAERVALARLSGADAVTAFFACWARKEAFVKGLGLGLSYPLDAFEVSIGDEPALIRGGKGWKMLAPPLVPQLASAVAIAATSPIILDIQRR